MKTINEIASTIYRANKKLNLQLYWNKNRNAVGYWDHTALRVLCLAGLIDIDGGYWAILPNLLVNGKPLIPEESWEPIPYEELTEKQRGCGSLTLNITKVDAS